MPRFSDNAFVTALLNGVTDDITKKSTQESVYALLDYEQLACGKRDLTALGFAGQSLLAPLAERVIARVAELLMDEKNVNDWIVLYNLTSVLFAGDRRALNQYRRKKW
jgi:hypothetical protein